MPDLLEKVDEFQQLLTDVAIDNIRRNTAIPVNLSGKCLCCGEPVEDGRRWCDAYCRDAAVSGVTLL